MFATRDDNNGAVRVAVDGHANTVELGERVGVQDVGDVSFGNDGAFVEEGEPVGVHAGKGEVVHGGDDGEAVFGAESGDEFEGLLLVADVEGAGWFVEEEDGRFGGEGAGDDESLAFATGELSEASVGELSEVEAVDDVVDHGAVVAGGGAEVADVGGASEQHVVAAGHVVGEDRVLGDVGDEGGASGAAAQSERGAVDEDVAAVSVEADGGAQQRRFSGAVRADEAEPFAGAHRGGEVVDGSGSAVAYADVAVFDGAHRATCRVRSSTMKNGAPMKAVTTPIGTSAGADRVRPGMSARMRKAAPKVMVMGSTTR